jgi:hypothetical protein
VNAGPDQTVNEGDIVSFDGSASIGSVTKDSNVIDLWHMNEGSGNVIYDETGNNNDGTINGATWTTGLFGNALSFDGINDYVALPSSSLNNLPEGTVEVWIKRDRMGEITETIIDKTETYVKNYFFYAIVNDKIYSTLDLGAYNDPVARFLFGNSEISSQTWHYIAITWDGKNVNMYVDGSLDASHSYTLSVPDSARSVSIGMNDPFSGYSGFPFKGIIDEIRISNRARTAQEIREYYDSGKEHFLDINAEIVSYKWDFENDGVIDYIETSDNAPDGAFDGMTTHIYADNGIYTTTLSVTDSNGGVATDTLKVTVNNVAPIVVAGQDQTANEYDIISLAAATFSDPGTSDTHSATINWGDGMALEEGIVVESDGTVSGSHSYAKYGLYTVEVCVTDNDGDSSCDTFELTVKDITPPVITINKDNPLTAVLGTPYEDGGATATDNSDGTIPVTTSGTVNTASVGTYTVTYTATDNSGNTATASRTANVIYAPAGSMCLDAPGHEILQPINKDGNSVFKKGSTVPAKFRVCDANGNSIGTTGVVSSFKLIQKILGTVINTVNEDVISTTPDMAFRWDSTAQQWIFNINTKNLLASYTYTYRISLNDGTAIDFSFGLK